MKHSGQKFGSLLWMPVLGSALILSSTLVFLADHLDRGFWQWGLESGSTSVSLGTAEASLVSVPFLSETLQGVTWAGLVEPPAKKSRRRVRRHRSEAALVADRPKALDKKVDGLLAEAGGKEALEVEDPLSALTDEGLLEEAVAWHRAVGWGSPNEEVAAEVEPYLETLGAFERNDFSHLREPLAAVKKELETLEIRPLVEPKKPVEKKVALEPELIRPSPKAKSLPAPTLAVASAPSANSARGTRPTPQSSEPTLVRPESVVSRPVAQKRIEAPQEEATEREPELVRPTQLAESQEDQDSEPTLIRPAVTVSPSPSFGASTGKVGRLKWKAAFKRADPPSEVVASNVSVPSGARGLMETSASSPVNVAGSGRVYGQVTWEPAVGQWLDAQKGHVELSLHPLDSTNSQDTLFVPYRYPASDFAVELSGSRSRYQLVASVFTPKSTAPVVRIPHGVEIGPDNFRTQVKFHLTQASLERLRQRSSASQSLRTLVLTVFEGGTGRVKDAQPIKGAAIQVVGFPEYGTRLADAQGNIRFESIPSHSEYLVRISSPGYYPAYSVVPVFGTDAYLPVYLVPRSRVKAINDFRYLVSSVENKSTQELETNNPLGQDSRKGFVMGRSFDPVKRQPLAGEVYGLTFRKDPALYFGALPAPELKASTESGMFAFFNVAPSFRAVRRETEGGVHRPVSLLKVRPGTGQYLEFGRGGLKDLEARIWDPYRQTAPPAKVRLVGDTAPRVETNGQGKVLFEDLDFGPGVVTVEVESDGYPLTWHTLPWNPGSAFSLRNLFVMEDDLLHESAKRFAGVQRSAQGGSVVGGAQSTFFKNRSCVKVKLLTDQGTPVDGAFGPFPLAEDPQRDQSLCLTKSKPGFTYFNLPGGEYVLRWEDTEGVVLRSHVIHVGIHRVSVVVN